MRKQIDVQDLLNQVPFSRFQMLIFVCTFLIAFFDGYDTAVIGYIAPSLLSEWGIEKTQLKAVLTAALWGLALGAISFGPLADKLGRKTVLLVSVIIFAVGAILSAYAVSLTQLELLRFVSGIGLGAAMPNAVTLLSEYCPQKRRALIVNTMFCGFPLGQAIGGFIAAWLIPQFGWRSTLLFGGVLPLILVAVMLFVLPESVRYLVIKRQPADRIRRILQKISPQVANADTFILNETNRVADSKAKSGIAVVLAKHYLVGSILLWIAYFMGLVIVYGLINWMPVLFRETEMSPQLASIVTGLFAIGGLGAIFNGYLMGRFNANRLIALLCLLTAPLIALIGVTVNIGVAALTVTVVLAGIMLHTAQTSLPALAADFYPTEGRTTGVSWMLGIGRFGGIAGSYLVAYLMVINLTLSQIFLVLACPALVMVACLCLKWLLYKETAFAAVTGKTATISAKG